MSERIDITIGHTIHAATGKVAMDINVVIEKGSIFALTGPSGAGKTTFLKLIAGLSKPDSGKIKFGNDVWLDSLSRVNIPVQDRKVGFVFQDYALFPNLTVRQNLIYALPKGDSEKIADDLLERSEMTAFANRKPYQLSGGQQQRVAIVRAIASRPQLLLLDEPMSALDSGFRQKVQDMLLDFHREYGFTMLIVTHQIADIFQLASKVAVIEEGKIVKLGTASQVFLSNDSEDDNLLYAEVLAIEQLPEYLSVSLLVQHKIVSTALHLNRIDDLKVGDKIGIPLNSLINNFQLIDSIKLKT